MWFEHSLSSVLHRSDPLPCSNSQWLALQATRVGFVAAVNLWENKLGVLASMKNYDGSFNPDCRYSHMEHLLDAYFDLLCSLALASNH